MIHSILRPRVIAVILGLAIAAAVMTVVSRSAAESVVPTVTAASSDYFLKLDDIKGESKEKGHEGSIQIESWSFGASNPVSVGSGGGHGAGKVSFSDLSVMKHIDAASTDLLKMCATGEHIKVAKLTARRAGARAEDYLRYTFHDVTCTSTTHSGSPTDAPTESVTFSYDKIEMEYKAKGSPEWERMGWDLKLNKGI
jgi:type VI secretion system secreted protein Hcp